MRGGVWLSETARTKSSKFITVETLPVPGIAAAWLGNSRVAGEGWQ